MFDMSKPRKRAARFEDIDKYKRKSVKVYYIVKDDLNVYTGDATNYDIDNPISIPTSY